MFNLAKGMSVGMLAMTSTLFFTNPAFAQEVRLSSSDGTVNMTGIFKEFRDNNYVITTALGDMRLSADRVSCIGDACPTIEAVEADVAIGGSDTLGLALMPLLVEGYAVALGAAADLVNTGTGADVIAELIGGEGFGDEMDTILISPTTSGNGFGLLQAKEIEVSMSSRRIRPAEARALRNDGAGNMISPSQEHIIAVDSLVVITNPDNPINTLSSEQLRGIYSGAITNWSEVGGRDLPIVVVGRAEGSGTRDVFESRIFGDNNVALPADAIVADTNSEAAQIVNETEGAIAFVGYAFQRDANAVTLINDCGISVEPSAFAARTEEYPLQRLLYLYTREDTLSETSRQLIDFAKSDAADSLIGKAGFIGFAVDRREQAMDGPRARMLLDPNASNYESRFMRQMLAQMLDFDRLSTTFRFRTGSSQLDERGRIDKARLIDYLAQQPEGTEVLFVGFTDSVGEFSSNLDLSARRAAQVARDMLDTGDERLSNIILRSTGFGEIAPMGCNDTDPGRRINRRVEVWIKSPT